MDDRISKLAKAAKASMRGEEIDPAWLFDQALTLLEQCESFQGNALWHTLVDTARALNDVGEYALGGEIFEMLTESSRELRYPKIEFDALEGLAQSWFYLGDPIRAIDYLERGLELAVHLKRTKMIDRFREAIENQGKPRFAGQIKAPADTPTLRRKRRTLVSSLLKKQRNRF